MKNRFKSIKLSSNHLLSILFLMIVAIWFIKDLPILMESFSEVINKNFRGIPSQMKVLDKNFSEDFYKKYSFLNANGLQSRLLNQKMMNTAVKLNNGYLTFVRGKVNIAPYAEHVAALNQYLKQKQIPMLYVQAPYKISKYDNQLPTGIEDYSNDNIDRLLSSFDKNQVNYVDLRSKINGEGLDHYSMFFKTDHHWTPDAAFWAYSEIINILNKQYNYHTDKKYTDLSNFKSQVYHNWFLGSVGRRTGINFAGLDDINLISPTFETKLSLQVPSKNISRQGSFSQTIFDMHYINRKDYFKLTPYSAYIGQDFPLLHLRNEGAPNQKKLLVVKDSFGIPVFSFMSLCFQQIDAIDLRYYHEKSLTEYIDETKPDMVVFIYSSHPLDNSEMFAFSK